MIDLGNIRDDIEQLLHQAGKVVKDGFRESNKEVSSKRDVNDLLTKFDIQANNIIVEHLSQEYPTFSIVSEESPEIKKDSEYTFLIDPIDGTRELARGVGECSISFGIYFSSTFNDPRNFSWIFNPFNSLTAQTNSKSINSRLVKRKRLLGFVSNTEFNNGLYDDLSSDITVIPKGSIAYKLGLPQRYQAHLLPQNK